MTTENPFVNSRRQIEQEYFIGREEESKTNIVVNIEDSIFEPESPLNLAIIGIPGIGKSSLAHKAIYDRREELIEKEVVPIWIHVSAYSDAQHFFISMVSNCAAKMEELGWLTKAMKDSAEAVAKTVQSDLTSSDKIRDFFQKVTEANYGTLFILNRFDHAGTIFKGNTAFELLGELANSSYRLSLVLTSHQTIAKVEEYAGSNSPFSKLFTNPICLAMFNDEDLDTYFSKFSDVGISISDKDRERILSYCGTHPYLLQVLGHQIVRRHHKTGEIDVDGTANDNEHCFSSYYQNLTKFLKKAKLLEPLLQILFDFSDDVKQTYKNELKELEKYGLIKATGAVSYATYSEYFHNYLSELHQNSAETLLKSTSSSKSSDPNWQVPERSTEAEKDLWYQTENALRKTIATILSAEFGRDWINTMKNMDRQLRATFERCEKEQKQESKKRAGENNNLPDLIYFTQPADVFDIVLHNNLWQHFREFFGKTDPNTDKDWKAHWKHARGIILSRFRNRDRHSAVSIPLHDVQKSNGYCNEILEICANVEQSVSSAQDQHVGSWRVLQTEADQDQESIEQEEGEQEELYKGNVFLVNQEDAYAHIRIEKHKSLGWIRVLKSDFQNIAAFKLGKDVKLEIEETGSSFQARNVDLAEGE